MWSAHHEPCTNNNGGPVVHVPVYYQGHIPPFPIKYAQNRFDWLPIHENVWLAAIPTGTPTPVTHTHTRGSHFLFNEKTRLRELEHTLLVHSSVYVVAP